MADLPAYTDTDNQTTASTPPSMPLWVKVFGIIAIVLVLLFVGMHLTGMGLGGHMMGNHTMPPGAAEHGVPQP
jgi:hypothetical protein